MDASYSGVIGLAQAVLAINLAYVGLHKFRYQLELQEMFQQALALIEGMPAGYRDDLAWRNIESIAEGRASEAWIGGHLGYKLYIRLFKNGTDRVISACFAVFSVSVLVAYAFHELVMQMNIALVLSSVAKVPVAIIDSAFFVSLLLGLLAPPFFVVTGRYMLKVARESMKSSLAHLGERFKADGGDDISAKLQAWGLDQ